jgi:hypothetical protein
MRLDRIANGQQGSRRYASAGWRLRRLHDASRTPRESGSSQCTRKRFLKSLRCACIGRLAQRRCSIHHAAPEPAATAADAASTAWPALPWSRPPPPRPPTPPAPHPPCGLGAGSHSCELAPGGHSRDLPILRLGRLAGLCDLPPRS